MRLPPLPTWKDDVFKHPLCEPYHFIGWDFEVFPNDVLLTVQDTRTKQFRCEWGAENIRRMLNMILARENTVLIGFNSRNYDNVIGAMVLQGYHQRDVKIMNDVLVDKRWMGDAIPYLRDKEKEPERKSDVVFGVNGIFDIYGRSYDAGYDLGQKRKGEEIIPAISLKRWQMLNGVEPFHCPIDFDKEHLTPEDRAIVEHYCKYDVASAVMICTFGVGFGNLAGRAGLITETASREKNRLGWGMTKPRLAAGYLEADKSLCPEGAEIYDEYLKLPECLDVGKHTRILDHYRQSTFNVRHGSIGHSICGLPHSFGIGGLHSVHDEPILLEGDIWDIDAVSLYPSIMIEYGYFPRSVKDPAIFKRLRDLRIQLKGRKDPMADALKIVLNSTFGASKNEFSALFDPQVGLVVCVVGQLLLVDLLDKVEPHIERLIQSNTDGIFVIPKKGCEENIEAAMREWEERTGMELDVKKFNRIYQYDVNNYVARGVDGKLKLKGARFKNAHGPYQTPAQRIATSMALGEVPDMSSFKVEDFVIISTRDKNTDAFIIDFEQDLREELRVVAVTPRFSQDISTLRKNGKRGKARLCPPSAALLSNVTDISQVDVDYYLGQLKDTVEGENELF